MPRGSVFKNNFSAGMISQLLDAREDTATYQNGAAELLNMIVLPQGGLSNRPGFEYIAEVKDSSKYVRLIPFIFSDEQAYVLEFGDNYIRVYRNQFQVTYAAAPITSISNANPAVVTRNSHGLSNGDQVIIDGVVGMTEVNGRRFTVANAATNTYELSGVNSTGYGAYVSGGTHAKIFEIASTGVTEAMLDEFQRAQSADTMWLVHHSLRPQEMTRSGHTSWTIGNYNPTSDPFVSDWPAAVAIYEQRICFANTVSAPQKVFGSKSNDYQDMTTGTNDDDGYIYVLGTNDVNPIQWLFPDQQLLVGTKGGVFVARGSGIDDPITPTNISIKRHVSYKACEREPTLVESVVLMIDRLAKRIYGLTGNDGGLGSKYTGSNASLRNPEITAAGVKQLAYQSLPYNTTWMTREDGALIGLTLEPNEQVLAWHPHETQGEIESTCVIPGENGDELWVVVKRTIDGQTRRYVELMHERIDDNLEDCFFVDSGLSYDGAPTDVFTGLWHLEGETVSVLADGATHPDVVVEDGAIVLDREASKIHVGLSYVSKVKSLRLAQGSADGTAQSKRKRTHEIDVRFYNTLGGKVGPAEDKLTEIQFRSASDPMDQPPPLFTGDKRITASGRWDTEGRVFVQQSQPLPMTVLGYVQRFVVNDG